MVAFEIQDGAWSAFWFSLPATIAAIGALIVSLMNRWQNFRDRRDIKDKTDNLAEKVDKVSEKVEEVHKATNSLTDRLVESTAKESHAAGIRDEKARREGQGN